jgi:hypothetical protein
MQQIAIPIFGLDFYDQPVEVKNVTVNVTPFVTG